MALVIGKNATRTVATVINYDDGVTDGADQIIGTEGRDIIYAGGGNDIIKGGGGADDHRWRRRPRRRELRRQRARASRSAW